MTYTAVYIIMGSLGILTGLVIAIFGHGRRWIRLPLALVTAAGVATTAWPNFWLIQTDAQQHFYQSLLLGSVIVLLSLLTLTLLYPSKRSRARSARAHSSESLTKTQSPTALLAELDSTEQPGRDSLEIDLDKSPETIIANKDEDSLVHLLSSTTPAQEELISQSPKTLEHQADSAMEWPSTAEMPSQTNDVFGEPYIDPQPGGSLAPEDEPLFDESADRSKHLAVSASEPDSNISEGDGDRSKVVSISEHREQRDLAAEADALDLSDSGSLFEAMREAEAELELPDEPSWLSEKNSVEFTDNNGSTGLSNQDDDAIFADDTSLDVNELLDEDKGRVDAEIEDAQIVSIHSIKDNEELAARADAPSTDSRIPPETLTEVLNGQRESIDQLGQDTEALEKQLAQWQALTNKNEQIAWSSSLQQRETVEKQQQRLAAENQFREAAVELIKTQRTAMHKLTQKVNLLGSERKGDLAKLAAMQKNLLKQRKLASDAAQLAKKATADKRYLAERLVDEQHSRKRIQGAAQRAMGIARNAVEKLAEHEHRANIRGDQGH